MTTAEKSREMRLRYTARRRRCELVKSRRRDPGAWDYGRYWIIAPHLGEVIGADGSPGMVGDAPGLTIDQVEKWLLKGYYTHPARAAS